MFNRNVKFINFIGKKSQKKIRILKNILKDKFLFTKYPFLKSLTKNYQYSYQKKKIKII